ncbi:CHAT domain-containing protein [Cupriavidus necator]|uniref:CHAT domain-containing protein n=1 Tax=Cupriavidus necator TaxID=106590 RepID=UPI0039C3E062
MKQQNGVTQRASMRRGSVGPAGTLAQATAGASRGLTLGQKRPAAAPPAKADPLAVEVVNGNLKFVDEPVLVGHYRGAGMAGAESVVDRLIGGALSTSMRLGRYPQDLKTQQVFVNTAPDDLNPLRTMPRPKGIVVVGLGDEGHLRAGGLAATVRLGVIAWAQHLAEQARMSGAAGVMPPSFTLAATLVGSGGTGISPGQAARSVAEGVYEANRLLRASASGWPSVARLTLVELFLDRATDAWRALELLDQACPGRYEIARFIRCGTGPLMRPLDSSYRGADFDLITAVTQTDEHGAPSIVYTLDTRRARTEVRAVAAQGRLLRELVTVASSDTCTDQRIGHTLFRLLIPLEMRPFLAGTTEMQIELDAGTAGIPWELLDSGNDPDAGDAADQKPWAIRAKLLRKLRTQEFRRQVEDVSRQAPVLVIGDPCSDDLRYPALSGARREANAVAELLSEALGGDGVQALVGRTDSDRGPDARAVIGTLLERDWGVVHIAGHGQPPADSAAKWGARAATDGNGAAQDAAAQAGGVVLSSGTFLGAEEFAKMQRVPELVFVNCCHLAHTDSAKLLDTTPAPPFDRPQFAASVADALIKLGVRCVVAAGWAVDDDAAETFALKFYEALVQGERFLDAVAFARDQARARGGNTWAAYQCYGDADWCLRGACGPNRKEAILPATRYAGVASPQALLLAIEEIRTELCFSRADIGAVCKRLRYLEQTFAAPRLDGDAVAGEPDRERQFANPQWGGMGMVADALAGAWLQAGSLKAAAAWYEKALAANDGGAAMRAAEQLSNVRVRLAWRDLQRAAAGGDGAVPPPAIDAARAQVRVALADLERLAAMHPTMERHALCGSASKRLAMIERLAGCREAEIEAIRQCERRYREAEAIGRAQRVVNLYYPLHNRCTAELVAHWATAREGEPAVDWLALSRESPQAKGAEPDFWSTVATTELLVCRSAAKRELAMALASIEQDFRSLHDQLPAVNNWSTELDQLDFVLSEYMLHVDAAEQQAARSLLRTLAGWAEPASIRG